MRRFGRGKKKRLDVENAFGSPAGVEMKDIDTDDGPMSTPTPEPLRIVSPPPPHETTSSIEENPPAITREGSAESLFDVAQTLEQASRSRTSLSEDQYKTPEKPRQDLSNNLSTGSSFGPMAQFNSINFSPDFSVALGAIPSSETKPPNDSVSDRSSDAGSIQEPFAEQIESLNTLLTTPVRSLGEDTPMNPDAEDDDLDQEMEDLEDNSRLLSRELSQVDLSLFPDATPGTSRKQASKKLFSPSPENSQNTPYSENSTSNTQQRQQLESMISPIPLDGSQLTTPVPGNNTTSENTPTDESNVAKENLASRSFSLSNMFGFRKTPMPKEQQLGIAGKPKTTTGEEDESVNASSMGVSSSSGDSIFQSLANFSAMYGDELPPPKNRSGQSGGSSSLLRDSNTIPEETMEFSGGYISASPEDERSRNQQQLELFDATGTPHQSTPSSGPAQFGQTLGAHKGYASPGLPSPAGMQSPLVYADDEEEEEGYFLSAEKLPQKLDYSSVRQKEEQSLAGATKTRDSVVGEIGEKETEPQVCCALTPRHIAWVCGLAVIVIICALLIALFATDILDDMNNNRGIEQFPSPTFSPTAVPTSTMQPTVTWEPSPLPTTTSSALPSPTIQEFNTSYNVLVSNGLVDSIPSDMYTPDLIQSMDQLSLVVLDNLRNGGNADGPIQRRVMLEILPSNIASIEEIECPGSTMGIDRCERITAEISLSDAADSVKDFKSTLEVAITIGSLQFYLDRVNPNSVVSILQASSIGPTPVPIFSPAPSTQNVVPSPPPSALATEASSMPTTSSPTVDPTRNQSRSPTAVPSKQPRTPTITPTLAPSLSPTSSPIRTPTIPPASFNPTKTHTRDPSIRPTTSPTVSNHILFDFLVQNSFDGGRALGNPSSPQYKAFSWLAKNQNLESYTETRRLQRYAMATLYYSTNGDEWLNNKNWLSDGNECGWYSKAGRGPCNAPGSDLINLELDYNNLNGFLPVELGLLSNSLERVVLHGGPSEALDGSIPTEVGYLTNLNLLYMPNNSMTGSFPSEMGRLTNLQQLNLSRTQLGGSLPSEIGNLVDLITIDLGGNSFTGQLPTEIGKLVECNKLLLDSNAFSGPIPSQIGKLSRLQELSASLNSFTSIPSQVGDLAFCDTIRLRDNDLEGTIPTELGDLRRLRLLDLGNNLLTGNIPSQLGKLVELRSLLDLATNRLTGKIPSELGNLQELRILNLRHNRLSGSIPSELAGMKRICEWLQQPVKERSTQCLQARPTKFETEGAAALQPRGTQLRTMSTRIKCLGRWSALLRYQQIKSKMVIA
eukprot:scaffold1605_cov141-Cylindrotheca_fusiformis.AAC.3